jgi:hypothetical protein
MGREKKELIIGLPEVFKVHQFVSILLSESIYLYSSQLL